MTAPALTRLRSSFDRLPGALQQAARWVADHPADVCFLSLREQARRADVVPPTMTRLSRALGYSSFRAFQDDFRAEVAWGSADFSVRARRMQTRGKRSDQGSERLAQLQAADIESLASLNAQADIERAAALLLETRRAAFLGFRSCHSAALHAHYLYSMLVGRAELLEDAYGTMLEAVASLDRQSVLVAFGLAPYSRQTIEAVQRARGQRAAVIAITDSELSPLARSADVRLLFEPASNSFFHSLVGAHALVERLMAEVATRGGRKVVQRLKARESLLRDANAYWQRVR
jgi:DNA-binding MurR/RpiR family transcriptional regulator